MRATWTAIAVATGLGLSVVGAGSASAGTVIYDFSGVCRDCANVGTGKLTLNNTPSGALNKSDFVSFSYTSNLVTFTIDTSSVVAVMGSIDPANLGKSYIDIVQMDGSGWEFMLNADGSWGVSTDITLGAGKPAPGAGGGGGGGGGGAPLVFGPPVDSSDGSSFSIDGADIQRIGDDDGNNGGLTAAATAVPEPAAWALMLTGFAGMGAMLRNRRRNPSNAAA